MNKDQIRQILTDQQTEVLNMMAEDVLIPRSQQPFLEEALSTKLIKVISGIRRSGKSTLALLTLQKQNFLYINFDDENLSQVRTKDLQSIFEIGLTISKMPKLIVLDEIQNVTGWELFVNRLHRQKYNVIVTGSNSRLLSQELATHLTGRHIGIEVFPFSFYEYLTFKKIALPEQNVTTLQRLQYQKQMQNYIETGGFPEVLQFKPDSRIFKNYLKELYSKIIDKDIAQRRKIKNIKALKEISLILMSQYASQFTYHSVKKVSTINSINTIKNYIEYLQESYLGFVVEPYSHKIKERISLPKKFYTIDIALSEAILGKSYQDHGKKIENIVFLELKRRDKEIYYIKAPNYEVDFLIREGRTLSELIQVSWSLDDEKTKNREVKALILAAKEYKIKKLLIITMATETIINTDGLEIQILPLWKWLLIN